MNNNHLAPAQNWTVRIQLVAPDGRVHSENTYEYANEADARDEASNVCELIAESDHIADNEEPFADSFEGLDEVPEAIGECRFCNRMYANWAEHLEVCNIAPTGAGE